eukprot:1577717-Pyramimonas_sp.AAC.1
MLNALPDSVHIRAVTAPQGGRRCRAKCAAVSCIAPVISPSRCHRCRYRNNCLGQPGAHRGSEGIRKQS